MPVWIKLNFITMSTCAFMSYFLDLEIHMRVLQKLFECAYSIVQGPWHHTRKHTLQKARIAWIGDENKEDNKYMALSMTNIFTSQCT